MNIITKMKNILEGINKLEDTKERLRNLEARVMESNQTEQQGK